MRVRRTQLLLACLVSSLAGCSTLDGSTLRWADSNSSDSAAMREELCLPRVSELEVPVFADAEIAWLEWPKKKPNCDGEVGGKKGEMVLVILMTKAPAQEVIDWYSARLPDFKKTDYLGGTFLAKGGDIGLASKREEAAGPTLFVGPPGDLWKQRGYRTSIDIQYRLR